MPARKPTQKDLSKFDQLLRQMLADLTGDTSCLESESFRNQEDAEVDSPEEGGSGGYSREVTLGLLEQNESVIREVMEALGRLESGAYGRCEICEQWIAKARLEAVPHARNCIECQREAEEEVA